MIPKSSHVLVGLFAVGTFTVLTAAVFSQGSGSSRTDSPKAVQAQTSRPQTPEEFYSSFWNHIVKKDVAYNTWKSISREKTDDGVENRHGSTSRTYANKVAADDTKTLPNGSILVREDYNDKGKRTSISVMYRVKDYDKDHGNWYWLTYAESGAIVRDDGKKAIAGKVTSCIDCHAKASGKDFVFSNDVMDMTNEPRRDGQSSDQKEPAKE